MRADSLTLLRRLNPAVSPVSTGSRTESAPRTSIDRMSFSDLLTLASSGVGSPVESRLGDDRESLSDEQLARLGAAVDIASENDFETALMLIDGRAILVDVDERAALEELQDEDPVRPVDGAVLVGKPPHPAPGPPGDGLPPPTLREPDRHAPPKSES